MRRWRIVGLLVLAVAILIAVASLFTFITFQSSPTAFYRQPSDIATLKPGDLIRSESVSGDLPPNTSAWKILYVSSAWNTGKPTAVSGVVFAPDGGAIPAGGRQVVAWAHPTTGISVGCAPSLQSGGGASFLPGLAQLIKLGYVVVATDYPGLGTKGPAPYLIGVSEGRAVLDSVRAARHLSDAHAGSRFVLWGHSQGGHAVLFAARLARTYAPDLHLVAAAAAAPASELTKILHLDLGTDEGNVFASMAFTTWSSIFPGASLNRIVSRPLIPVVRSLGSRCINRTSTILLDLPGVLLLDIHFLRASPLALQPWKSILSTNSVPEKALPVPVFLAQGSADTVVHPPITRGLARSMCRTGGSVRYVVFPGVNHGSIGYDSASQVVRWIHQQFEGRHTASSCGAL